MLAQIRTKSGTIRHADVADYGTKKLVLKTVKTGDKVRITEDAQVGYQTMTKDGYPVL